MVGSPRSMGADREEPGSGLGATLSVGQVPTQHECIEAWFGLWESTLSVKLW